jgi:hypothetical protein
MKTRILMLPVCVGLLLMARSAGANDKHKGPKGSPARGGATELKVNARSAPSGGVSSDPKAAGGGKEPWVGVKVVFSDDERRIVHAYAQERHEHEKAGRKGKGLPPGLAKKVAHGGSLPPGWQKKCVRGEVLSEEVHRHCHPLPREVVLKLPPPPPGTILVAIDGKVVRLAKATREILDVFDVKF